MYGKGKQNILPCLAVVRSGQKYIDEITEKYEDEDTSTKKVSNDMNIQLLADD